MRFWILGSAGNYAALYRDEPSWLLSTVTSIVTLSVLFLIVIVHHRKAKTLFEKLNQLHDDRKTQEQIDLKEISYPAV